MKLRSNHVLACLALSLGCGAKATTYLLLATEDPATVTGHARAGDGGSRGERDPAANQLRPTDAGAGELEDAGDQADAVAEAGRADDAPEASDGTDGADDAGEVAPDAGSADVEDTCTAAFSDVLDDDHRFPLSLVVSCSMRSFVIGVPDARLLAMGATATVHACEGESGAGCDELGNATPGNSAALAGTGTLTITAASGGSQIDAPYVTPDFERTFRVDFVGADATNDAISIHTEVHVRASSIRHETISNGSEGCSSSGGGGGGFGHG